MSAPRFIVLVTAATAALGLAPTAASAVTTVSLSGTTLTVVGGPEVNNVTIGVTTPDVNDPAGVIAGEGCSQSTPTKAYCGWDWERLEGRFGDGDDVLTAGALSPRYAVVDGEGGNDDLGTGGMADQLSGGAGNDRLASGGGDDSLNGGPGNDTIQAGGGNDNIDAGAGTDSVSADGYVGWEDGNDVINIRDGESDTAQCGLGADRVVADAVDVIDLPDCESVDVGTTPTTPTTPSGPGALGPKVTIAPHAKVRLRTLVKSGIGMRMAFSTAGRATVRLTVSGTQARKLGLRRKTTIGKVSRDVLAATRTIRVRPSERFRNRLRRLRRSIKMAVEVTETTSAGKATAKRSVTFVP